MPPADHSVVPVRVQARGLLPVRDLDSGRQAW